MPHSKTLNSTEHLVQIFFVITIKRMNFVRIVSALNQKFRKIEKIDIVNLFRLSPDFQYVQFNRRSSIDSFEGTQGNVNIRLPKKKYLQQMYFHMAAGNDLSCGNRH